MRQECDEYDGWCDTRVNRRGCAEKTVVAKWQKKTVVA
jgi:hypothetical protein